MAQLTPLQKAFWRTAAVYRAVGVLFAVAIALATGENTSRPWLKALLLVGMSLWSVLVVAFGRRRLLPGPLMAVDLAVAVGLIAATRLVDTHEAVVGGAPTLPSIWVTAPVLVIAAYAGPWIGGAAGCLVAAAALLERGEVVWRTVNNALLVIVAGAVIGYLARVSLRAEAALADATAVASAQHERERLGREIHDSVLQALAFITRRGREIGGETGDLAELASEQEQALRRLVTTSASPVTAQHMDVVPMLAAVTGRDVHLSAPVHPVVLPAHVAAEVVAAVTAALDNVARHAGDGTQSYILVEDDPEYVVVSVRDTGRGIAPGRLKAAADAGRLGFAQSIRGRIESLGGKVTLTSGDGEGTEVEMHVPRRSR